MALFRNIFKKRDSNVSADRVALEMMGAWSPLEILTPRGLAHVLNAVKAGNIAEYARLWDDVRQRDDVLAGVEPKRRKDCARLDYELIQTENTAAAARQKQVVAHLLSNLRYEDALDADKSGGLAALVRGMMASVGAGWSVQEIIWNPASSGLTARVRHVPLWFFERRKGRMRYLERAGDYDGVELDRGGWLITACDDKLAIASLVLYLYKHMPLRDWLVYCQRYVVPGLHGKSPAKMGSTEWNDLKNALHHFGQDWVLLSGTDVKVENIDASAKGPLPYGPLIERCDRRLAALWRGADLSTLSARDAVGSNLQHAEADMLLADDACMIEDTLNSQLIRYALDYTFGENTPALVAITLGRPNTTTETDLKVYDRLHRWGLPVAVADVRDRFGIPTPKDKDDVLFAEPAPNAPITDTPHAATAPPHAPRPAAHTAVYSALAGDLAPLRDALADTAALPDADLPAALAALNARLPQLHAHINSTGSASTALANVLAAAVADGLQDNPSKVTDA